MENTQRNAYDAAFKLKAIDLAVKKGNRAAARKLEKRWRWEMAAWRTDSMQKDDKSF